jgi:aspartate/tyrosine/aromatic aminotransferase
VQILPSDPILGLVATFKEDAAPSKVNVAQGAYRTDEGLPFVLTSIKEAEHRVASDLEAGKSDKEYLPIEGDARFRTLTARLAFGPDSPSIREERVATLQTISGTGAVSAAATSLLKIAGKKDIWVSDPSWGNHAHIFKSIGLNVHPYTYLDKKTGTTLDFAGMLEDMKSLPEGSAVLLHACAHNPTGIDPNLEQWEELAKVFLERKLVAFFDSAYQGYASGDLDADAASVRMFEKAGVLPIVCQSYAKSLGLYGERIGAVNFVCASKDEADALMSQVKQGVIRPIYSSPPLHGARLAAHVLGDPALFAQWGEELKVMSGRVQSMRSQLADELRRIGAPAPDGGSWSHITDQIGMFAFTGLSADHVDKLRTQYHVYMTRDGRMSMAGLRSSDVPYVASKMKDVLTD